MMITDTHTHLYLDDFGDEKDTVVSRAIDAGVTRMVFPNVDRSTVAPMRELHAKFHENTAMAIGLHPTEVNGDDIDSQLQFVRDELSHNPQAYVAVGEIGIDLYWDKTFRQQQIEVLARQMTMAADMSLPVIIHCREGLNEVLDVIDSLSKIPAGVFHSFGGTVHDVKAIRQRGDFFFGINGIVTFKNSRLREVLPEIGAERILLETDAPYLAPVPHHGKRNESAYIIHTCAHVAAALGISAEQLADITSRSAERLFFKSSL